MYDPYDGTWTDANGRIWKLTELEPQHLFNIQRYLSRRLRNLEIAVAQENLFAAAYNAEYEDKDWFSPALEADIDEVQGELKVALMKVSEEVNRRQAGIKLKEVQP